ncbi:MAG: glycosyltransferase [Gemmataceae bacterium]|nr:glycosyltransferase [Gemmataceae bacterium]
MRIVHLMASPFYGGPERQMLGLARHLPGRYESVFVSFAEGGRCAPFLDQVRRGGFEAYELEHNAPRMRQAANEVARLLRKLDADVLSCSGYKPDIIGWWAARQAGIPAVSISHGWTAATWKVRVNETCDRLVIRWMDAVVCVSKAQAAKVRRAGVPDAQIAIIHNAVADEAFAPAEPQFADRLAGLFPRRPRWLVGAAGRLSPEKGFADLVEAAALALRRQPEFGFVVFGDGPLRPALTERIATLKMADRCILAGFRDDAAKYLPHLDLAVLPSLTEGLPVILLEAFAAGLPVVATAVGGIPEVVEPGVSGLLAPAGNPTALAERIVAMFGNAVDRRAWGQAGQARVRREFTFATQSVKYQQLFDRLARTKTPRQRRPAAAVVS